MSLRQYLRPMLYARRRGLHSGVFGGNRRWLVIGGVAWGLHWLGRVLGTSEPRPVHTADLVPGERLVIVHEPESPRAARRRQRRERRRARRAA